MHRTTENSTCIRSAGFAGQTRLEIWDTAAADRWDAAVGGQPAHNLEDKAVPAGKRDA